MHLKSRFSELNYETANINNFKTNRNDAVMSFDFDYQAENYSKRSVRILFFPAIPFNELTSINNTEERKLPLKMHLLMPMIMKLYIIFLLDIKYRKYHNHNL